MNLWRLYHSPIANVAFDSLYPFATRKTQDTERKKTLFNLKY